MKKNTFLLALIIMLISPATGIGAGESPANSIDYAQLGLPNVDGQGFRHMKQNGLEFDYRTTISYEGNPGLLAFGAFGPEAKGVVEVKNLSRDAEVSGKVSGQAKKSFYAEFGMPYFCILGQCLAPLQSEPIAYVDGAPLRSFIVSLPENAGNPKFKDTGNPGGVFPLNEKTAFYFEPSVPTATFDISQQLLIGSLLFLAAALALGFIYAKMKEPKARNFPQKKLFALALLCLLLMIQISAFSPTEKIVVSFDAAASRQLAPQGIIDGEPLPKYLWLALAQSGAIEGIIVGETANCPPKHTGLSGQWALSALSVEKIFVVSDGYSCSQDFPSMLMGKNILVPRKQLAEIYADYSRENESPATNAAHKIIFLLSGLALFFAAAGLSVSCVWLAAKKGWKKFLAWLLLAVIGLPLGSILAGWLAHIPVTYHGASTLALTMGQGLVPGILNQGHSLRFGLALLGALAALLYSGQAREFVSPKKFIGLLALASLLLAIPPVALEAKKLYMNFECANCFNEFSGQTVFADQSARPGPYAEFFAQIDRLRYQNKKDEAIALLAQFIENNPGTPEEGTAQHILGNVLWEKGLADQAIPHYEIVTKSFPNEFYRKASLFKLGDYFMRKGDYGKATEYYAMMAKDYPGTPYAEFAEKKLAEIREKNAQGEGA